MKNTLFLSIIILLLLTTPAIAQEPTLTPLRKVVDLAIGETVTVVLHNGTSTTVKLVALEEDIDEFRDAVREARVTVDIDGEQATLISATYNLPKTVGRVQVDCPITRGYFGASTRNLWGLTEGKVARLRLWPKGSPWIAPGTFVHPARQRWLASDTQMSNEPAFVDAGEDPARKSVYYHNGLDIGGVEGMMDVLSATDALVVSKAGEFLEGHDPENTPVRPRYDVIYTMDNRGWYYRYSHLKSHETNVVLGERVTMGQKMGELGKEGASGGWSHFHFDISSRQPSGNWGTEDGYAFYWQSYMDQYKPKIMAVARPHMVVAVGETVVLDGSKSWSAAGEELKYIWNLPDGVLAFGPKIERVYDTPGIYSEILSVMDSSGNVDYDFMVVNVIDKNEPEKLPPTIHAAFSPTFDIQPGDPVTFAVRVFRSKEGGETWNFGDRTPRVKTVSHPGDSHLADGYAFTTHRFQSLGHYIVTVEHTAENGLKAVAHLEVRVGL